MASWSHSAGTAKGSRALVDLARLLRILAKTWIVPLWVWFVPAAAISAGAVYLRRVSPPRDRARGIGLALLPLALALPAFAFWMAQGHHLTSLQTLGGNYLIGFTLLVAAPMIVDVRRSRSSLRDLVFMSLPVGIVGFVLVSVSSSASIFWASGIVGLAPLVLASLVWWGMQIGEGAGEAAKRAAIAVMLLGLLLMLFGVSIDDASPLVLRSTITAGPFAGVTTTPLRATRVAEIERLGTRWVGPQAPVTVVFMPGAYLLTGGVPLTNVTWLDTGNGLDPATVAYFDSHASWPEVVFVPFGVADAPAAVIARSPFLTAVMSRYTLVERSAVARLAVYAYRGSVPAVR